MFAQHQSLLALVVHICSVCCEIIFLSSPTVIWADTAQNCCILTAWWSFLLFCSCFHLPTIDQRKPNIRDTSRTPMLQMFCFFCSFVFFIIQEYDFFFFYRNSHTNTRQCKQNKYIVYINIFIIHGKSLQGHIFHLFEDG